MLLTTSSTASHSIGAARVDTARLGSTRLRTAFQAVVNLDTGAVLGAEALLRADVAGRAVPPLELLAWAKTRGTLAELDLSALRGAIAAAGAVGRGVLLVNVEPSTLMNHTSEVIAVLEGRPQGLHVVVEVTERALAADPAALLRATEALHRKGYPIAVDDIGANPQSLALLEVIRPGVVKLDMSLLRDYADPDGLHVAGAVAAYAEAVGASVIASGIETQEDLSRARVLGASFGQGALWGPPGPRWPEQVAESPLRYCPPPHAAPRGANDTPFSVISRHKATRVACGDMLVPLSLAVEASVARSHLPAILLATVQHVRHVPPSTRDRFARLAQTLPLVGMLGEFVTDLRIPHAHLTDLRADDPLCLEWSIVALGAQSAVALTAREQPPAHGCERNYEFTTTYERHAVVAAAATLISRLGSFPPSSAAENRPG
jgi:EAL domain-containing protein (putative c-di-GMP-specific phosphodiesterase class I)